MLNENEIKLHALNYAEKRGIVNAKTIKAIQFGVLEGYRTFNKHDCINYLKGYFENSIKNEEMNYHHTGKFNEEFSEKCKKNLELLKQIEL